MRRLVFSTIGFIFICHSVFGNLKTELADTLGVSKKDSVKRRFINEYRHKFYIKPLFTIRNLNLELQSVEREISDLEYKANSNAYFGLGFYFFDVGLEVSFKLPETTTRNTVTFGETNIFDFQTNIYAKQWGADIAFQRYRGFFLEDPQLHIPSWQQGDPFPQRPDLRLNNFQLNAFYIFNHNKFSYRSAYNQSDRQLRSAGSPLLNIFTGTFRFKSDSILIPEQELFLFGDEGRLNFGRLTTLALMPGYTYNLIVKRFYFNLSVSLGPGHVWVRYDVEGRINNDINIRPIFNLRTAAGYNSDSFFGGMSFVNQNVNGNIGSLDINGFSGNFKIFIGYRFKEKGFLTKEFF